MADIGTRTYTITETAGGDFPVRFSGKGSGGPHKSKPAKAVTKGYAETPAWFQKGVDAALLAPTAINQQKFQFSLSVSTVSAKAGLDFYGKVDLGIVKYHFETGAGKENFT